MILSFILFPPAEAARRTSDASKSSRNVNATAFPSIFSVTITRVLGNERSPCMGKRRGGYGRQLLQAVAHLGPELVEHGRVVQACEAAEQSTRGVAVDGLDEKTPCGAAILANHRVGTDLGMPTFLADPSGCAHTWVPRRLLGVAEPFRRAYQWRQGCLRWRATPACDPGSPRTARAARRRRRNPCHRPECPAAAASSRPARQHPRRRTRGR